MANVYGFEIRRRAIVPFLNKTILTELLKTYPNANNIEEEYKSVINNSKNDHYSGLTMLRDNAIKLKDSLLRMSGRNSTKDSANSYSEVRALIDDATRNNRIDAWAEIICAAGEGGYRNYSTALFDSKFCRVSFALLMYIRNQIDDRIKSIEDKVKTCEDKIKPLTYKSTSLEDKIKLLQVKLEEDDELALKVHASIQKKIADIKQLIQKAMDNIEDTHSLKLNVRYANSGKNFHDSSLEVIDIYQRRLYFLGAAAHELKPAKMLFPKFLFNIDKLRNDYELSPSQAATLDINLPIFLQHIYPVLYFKDHFPNIKDFKEEGIVIEGFEHLAGKTKPAFEVTKPAKVTPPKLITRAAALEANREVETNAEKLTPPPPPAATTHQIDAMSYSALLKKTLANENNEQKHGEPENILAAAHAQSNVGLFKTDPNKQVKQNPLPPDAAKNASAAKTFGFLK